MVPAVVVNKRLWCRESRVAMILPEEKSLNSPNAAAVVEVVE